MGKAGGGIMMSSNRMLLAGLVFLVLPSLTNAWLSDYEIRMPINISTTNTTLTAYQFNINFTYQSGMQTDFDDINITDELDSPVPFWIEEKVDGEWASIWFKLTANNGNGTQAYIYYIRPADTNHENPEATFIVYDDFDDGTKDCTSSGSGTWTVSNGWLNGAGQSNTYLYCFYDSDPQVVDGRVVAYANTNGTIFDHDAMGVLNRWSASNSHYSGWVSSDDDIARIYKFETIVYSGSYTSVDNEYLRFELIDNQTDHSLFVNHSFVGGGTEATWRYGYIGFWTYEDNSSFKYIFATQYIHPEPTVTLGSPEYNVGTSWTINSPANITYWNATINADFTALTNTYGVFDVKYWLDGSLDYDNSSYINNTNIVVPLGISTMGLHNFTLYVNGSAESVFFTVESFAEGEIDFDAIVVERAWTSYSLDERYNPDLIDNVTAGFWWNGTFNGTATGSTTNGTHFVITQNYYIPNIEEQNETVQFLWNLTIHYANGTSVTANSTNSSQLISAFVVDNCTFSSTVALNFTFWDEDNKTSTRADFDFVASSFYGDFAVSWENVSYAEVCIFPSWMNISISADAQYTNDESVLRNYYLTNYYVDNDTDQLELYLMGESGSYEFKAIVEDTGGDKQQDVIIKVLKYFWEDNAYKTISMGKTNFDGEYTFYLRYCSTDYRFLFEQDGEVVLYTDKTKVCESSKVFVVGGEELIPYYTYIGGVTYNYTVADVALYGRVVYITVTDTSGGMSSACARAVQKGILYDTETYDGCVSGTAVTLTVILGNETANNQFVVYGWIVVGGETVPIFLLDFNYMGATVTGESGLIIAAFFVMLMAFMGIGSPVAAIFLGIIGLGISVALQLVVLQYTTIVSLVLVGIIIAVKAGGGR